MILSAYGGGALDEPWSVIKGTTDEALPISNWRGMIDRECCLAVTCRSAQLAFPRDWLERHGWSTPHQP